MPQKIVYEQPLNERVRTLLRLEFLFLQVRHNLNGCALWDSRATLAGVFDILNVCSRSDLKSDILKELERHAESLSQLEHTPGVDVARLNQILTELDALIDRMHAMNGQPGQALRQNEFLNSIKQRSSIPGGLCDFDLPAYHYWSQRPVEQRTRDLCDWLSTLEPLRLSVDLLLRLLRDCAMPTHELAGGGFFQKSLDAENPSCQLVRVAVPNNAPYYAEISGGKHRFTVRFMEPVPGGRAAQTAGDVEFDLTCCIL
ncbi:MAG: cell division protein ZapD [Pseudomonadota bacterium]